MKYRLQINNRISEISRLEDLMQELENRNNLTERLLHEVNLIIEELVSNTILYGYPVEEENKHHIDIEIIVSRKSLRIHISDDAFPFNPLESGLKESNKAKEISEVNVGGLGLGLVGYYSDEIKYAYLQNRNHIWIVKYFT